jgi:hypothetical protein
LTTEIRTIIAVGGSVISVVCTEVAGFPPNPDAGVAVAKKLTLS